MRSCAGPRCAYIPLVSNGGCLRIKLKYHGFLSIHLYNFFKRLLSCQNVTPSKLCEANKTWKRKVFWAWSPEKKLLRQRESLGTSADKALAPGLCSWIVLQPLAISWELMRILSQPKSELDFSPGGRAPGDPHVLDLKSSAFSVLRAVEAKPGLLAPS